MFCNMHGRASLLSVQTCLTYLPQKDILKIPLIKGGTKVDCKKNYFKIQIIHLILKNKYSKILST